MSEGSTPSPFKTSAALWDAVRKNFVASDFAEVSLNSLAENIGLDGWPLKSADETPSKYLELTLDELRMMPGFNQRPKLIDQLVFILKSTLEEEGGFSMPAAKPAEETAAKAVAATAKTGKGVPGAKTTGAQWDAARRICAKSMLVDMKLASLAENLELPSWPFAGEDETPGKYIDFTLEELSVMTEFHGKPHLIDRLYAIIHENASHDEEFEEMVIPINQHLDKTDVLQQVLRKLEVPLDYPFDLLMLPKAVRETAPREQVKTLGQFVQFYQRISEKGVVLGEIKTILQAISSADEPRLAGWMPLRPGAKGFHLIEAIALIIKTLDQDTLKSLIKKYGKKLDPQDDYLLKNTWNQHAKNGEKTIQDALPALVAWFQKDADDVRNILNGGGSMDLDRYLLPLGDSDLELIVAHALIQHLQRSKPATIGAPAAAAARPAKADAAPVAESGGLLGKLKSIFGKK